MRTEKLRRVVNETMMQALTQRESKFVCQTLPRTGCVRLDVICAAISDIKLRPDTKVRYKCKKSKGLLRPTNLRWDQKGSIKVFRPTNLKRGQMSEIWSERANLTTLVLHCWKRVSPHLCTAVHPIPCYTFFEGWPDSVAIFIQKIIVQNTRSTAFIFLQHCNPVGY